VQITAEYWSYEICFGRSVRQFRGDDSYLLGADVSMVERSQVYTNGHECSALPNRPSRKTVVRLGCQEGAVTPRIASIQESSMCVYDMIIATNRVCGDPTFPLVQTTEYVTSSPVVDSGSEDWVLEIAELEDQRVMCAAYSMEMRSTGSKLSFKKFDLSISGRTHSEGSQEFTARHPGREVCGSDEVALNTDGHLRSLAPFNGKLSYLKIYG